MGRRDMIEQRAIIKPCTVRAAGTADFQYMGFSISLHGRLQRRSMAIQAWAFCHSGSQHSYTPLQELKSSAQGLETALHMGRALGHRFAFRASGNGTFLWPPDSHARAGLACILSNRTGEIEGAVDSC